LVAALVAALTVLYFVGFMLAIALVLVTRPITAAQSNPDVADQSTTFTDELMTVPEQTAPANIGDATDDNEGAEIDAAIEAQVQRYWDDRELDIELGFDPDDRSENLYNPGDPENPSFEENLALWEDSQIARFEAMRRIAQPEGDNTSTFQEAHLTGVSATPPTTDSVADAAIVDDPWQSLTAAPQRPHLRLVGAVHEFLPMPLLPAAKSAVPVDYAAMTVAQLWECCEKLGIEWRNAKPRKPLRKGELVKRLTKRAA
jgi:hypothetical protein